MQNDLTTILNHDPGLAVIERKPRKIPRRRKGFKPGRRPCIMCMHEDGKTRKQAMFNSMDETDVYCPKHKLAKRWREQEYCTEEDYGA